MFEDSRSRNIKFIKPNTEVLSLYCVNQYREMGSFDLPLGKSVYHRLLEPPFSRDLSPQLIALRLVTTTSQFAAQFWILVD